MFKTQAFKFINDRIGDGDLAFPYGPTITIFNTRATPAETNLAIGVS